MTRKHILRTVLEEIIVTVDGNQIGLRLHWKGGDHTELTVRKNRHGHTRWTIDTDTELLIRELARLMSDRSIAAHLNRGGRRTGRNNSWNVMRVRWKLATRVICTGGESLPGDHRPACVHRPISSHARLNTPLFPTDRV